MPGIAAFTAAAPLAEEPKCLDLNGTWQVTCDGRVWDRHQSLGHRSLDCSLDRIK